MSLIRAWVSPPLPPPPLALSLPYLLSFLSSLLPSLLSHSSFISLCLFLSATNCLNSGSKNANLSPIHAWVSPSLPLPYPLFSLSSLPPSLLSHSLLSLSVSLENICKHYNKLTKIKIQKCELVTQYMHGYLLPPLSLLPLLSSCPPLSFSFLSTLPLFSHSFSLSFFLKPHNILYFWRPLKGRGISIYVVLYLCPSLPPFLYSGDFRHTIFLVSFKGLGY